MNCVGVDRRIAGAICILSCIFFAHPACGQIALTDQLTPFRGYVYDAWQTPVSSHNGYIPERVIRGSDFGVGEMSTPQDLFLSAVGELYILDAGNSRILILDRDLELIRVITSINHEGVAQELSDPRGLFVAADGTIYLTDRENSRVLVCDPEGSIIRVIETPVSEVVPDGFVFMPEKLVVDRGGRLYVQSFGVFEGLVTFTPSGNFVGFFGSNRVVLSLRIVRELFWKRLLSREQAEAMIRIVPEEYSNVDIDSEGFVYTSTVGRDDSRNEIKRINPLGVNILRSRNDPAFPTDNFGDLEVLQIGTQIVDSRFVDVDVDESGFINGLDANRGRVFQYDQESNLLFSFGGLGDQIGLFKQPVAIESIDDIIVVLDTRNADITVFRTSAFGDTVRRAIRLHNDGLYAEAIEPWNEVLAANANYRLASIGIGKANLLSENYEEALRNFRLGFDRGSYSQAYRYFRTEYLRDRFTAFATISVLALALVWAIFVRKSLWRRLSGRPWPERVRSGLAEKFSLMTSVMIHPLDSFNEIKQQNHGSPLLAGMVVLFWFFATTLRRQSTGFIFNYNNPEELNILIILITTIVIFLLWTVSNWCVASILDGEGTLKDIGVYSAYALQPFVIAIVLTTIASNFITLEERIFLDIVRYIGAGWSVALILSGIKTLHQYSFAGTLLSTALAVAGIGVMIFLFTLVFTMFQEFGDFIAGIISEIRYRL